MPISAVSTVPFYLRISKTLHERLTRFAHANGSNSEAACETLLRLGLFIHAMPDGATIIRKRAEILGVASISKAVGKVEPTDVATWDGEF